MVSDTFPRVKVGIFFIAGKKIHLYSESIQIGSHPTCEINLSHFSLSKFHANFQWTNSGFVITDLNSKTKTRVNNIVLKPLSPVLITHSPAIIAFGKLKGMLMVDKLPLKHMVKAVRDSLRLSTGSVYIARCIKCNTRFLRKKMLPEQFCDLSVRDMTLYCNICRKKKVTDANQVSKILNNLSIE